MTKKKNKIVVPTDFTKVSEVAMAHAINVASHNGAEVYILNIVPKKKDVAEARQRLEIAQARAQKIDTKVPVYKLVRIGSIYEDIGDAAAEIDANLIMMGTHGMRGLQFVTGSRILRLVTTSEIPFIVTQERGIKPTGYNSIVVPLDLHDETRQKLTIVADMAKTFDSKVHLIIPKEDDELLHKKLENNIKFANHYLDERGIKHDATIAQEDSNHFVKAVVNHAKAVDADLITIMNLTQGNIFGVLGVPYEQEIITNEAQVPVMCITPRHTGASGGWSFQ